MFSTYAIIATISYLLGSIPFGYILVRVFLKQDIRTTGSGNIGATNVGRTGHKGLAIATLLLDAGKGVLAVFVAHVLTWPLVAKDLVYCGRWVDFSCGWPEAYATSVYAPPALAALAAIAGHMFPVWLKFRGGKGVATAVGAFGCIAPHSVVVSLLLFVVVVAISRYVSLGSVLSAFSFPIFIWLFNTYLASRGVLSLNPPVTVLFLVSAASLLVILKHHANIRRLLAGTEPKLGAKTKLPPPQQMEKQA